MTEPSKGWTAGAMRAAREISDAAEDCGLTYDNRMNTEQIAECIDRETKSRELAEALRACMADSYHIGSESDDEHSEAMQRYRAAEKLLEEVGG